MNVLGIHRWTTPGPGSVNSYWIETATGVIVVDGQRALSQARQMRADIDATGKPVLAAFLTHPHPDHFGGIGVFAPKGSGVPLYASRTTRDSIATDRMGLIKASHAAVGEDFPREVAVPDHEVTDGQMLEIGGVRIEVRELGVGEAECMTALFLPEASAFFVADAVQHAMTAYLLEGHSGAWLAQLAKLAPMVRDGTVLYPGHGEPGGVELIRQQAAYLETFRDLVSRHGPDGAGQVVAAMQHAFPGYLPVAAIPDLLDRDVPPLMQELGIRH